MPTNVERAYLAGLIDGEGHIGVTFAKVRANGEWRHHNVILTVSNTFMPVMTWVRSLWGGTLVVRATNRGSEAQIGNLRWSWRSAGEVLQDVRPYLRIKAAQADLAITLAKEVASRKPLTGRITKEEWDRREEIRLAIRQLNRPDPTLAVLPYPHSERPPKVCAFCGNEFPNIGSTAKYCSNKCVLKAKWQRHKAKYGDRPTAS